MPNSFTLPPRAVVWTSAQTDDGAGQMDSQQHHRGNPEKGGKKWRRTAENKRNRCNNTDKYR